MKNKVISLQYLENLVEQSIQRDKKKQENDVKPVHYYFGVKEK